MTPEERIAKARTFIGVITKYSQDAALQGVHCTDCSGFAARVDGVDKHRNGVWYGTDRIHDDAIGAQAAYKRIAAPIPGCWMVYGAHTDAAGTKHCGHIALCVDPQANTIIDCSGSHNGVYEHVDTLAHFLTRSGVVFCLPVGAT